MTRTALTVAAFLGLTLAESLVAEEEPKPVAIGSPAPEWNGLPGVDGKKHSLKDLHERKAVLVVFYDNTCPDCELYTDRILSVARDYQKKDVATVLINVSTSEENGLPEMKKLAEKKKFPCDYILDRSQKIGRAFGAHVTPQAFVLDGDRNVVYHGAIDDHWKAEKVKRKHVRAALDEVLAGKKVSVPKTEALGCFIEYDEP